MKPFLLFIMLFVPGMAFASDSSQYATDLAAHLYCSTIVVLGGDIGVLLGLALSAAGLIMLLYSGISFSNIIFILGGLLLTAIPGFFESFMMGVGQVFRGLDGNANVFSGSKLPDPASIQKGGFAACGPVPKAPADQSAETFAASQPGVTAQYATAGQCNPSTGSTMVSGGTCSSAYGMRTHPIKGGQRMHSGIDIAASHGSPIVAPASGEVSSIKYDAGGYGHYAIVDHGDGKQTLYGHLPSDHGLSVGQKVTKGNTFTKVGNTGGSTGAHLHYEERINGRAVDPCGSRGFNNVC